MYIISIIQYPFCTQYFFTLLLLLVLISLYLVCLIVMSDRMVESKGAVVRVLEVNWIFLMF